MSTGLGTEPPQSLAYEYEANGNVHTIADTRTGETSEFTYDALDRVARGWSSLFDESYSHSEIGNRTKTAESRSYPTSPAVRPHAPTAVAGNTYTYDDNGNLTAAESRTYEYDVENRLGRVLESGSEIKAVTYDGDGALRTMSAAGALTTRYVASDYQVNVPTGEVTLYYSFGGRTMAWHNDTTLRYLLTDHLGSSHGEASDTGTDSAQRRYLPFGGDRAVTGANNLSRDERYTGQKRISAGNNNARRELYHYGARWYLPGVGMFTQPDLMASSSSNPQDLNRYGYVRGNPLALKDDSGHLAVPAGEGYTAAMPGAQPPASGPVTTATPPPAATPMVAPQSSVGNAYTRFPSLAQVMVRPPPSVSRRHEATLVAIQLRGVQSQGFHGNPDLRGLDDIGADLCIAAGSQTIRRDSFNNVICENGTGPVSKVQGKSAITLGHVIVNPLSSNTSEYEGMHWLMHEYGHLLFQEAYGSLTTLLNWARDSGLPHDYQFMEMVAEQYANLYTSEYMEQPTREPAPPTLP